MLLFTYFFLPYKNCLRRNERKKKDKKKKKTWCDISLFFDDNNSNNESVFDFVRIIVNEPQITQKIVLNKFDPNTFTAAVSKLILLLHIILLHIISRQWSIFTWQLIPHIYKYLKLIKAQSSKIIAAAVTVTEAAATKAQQTNLRPSILKTIKEVKKKTKKKKNKQRFKDQNKLNYYMYISNCFC